MPEEILNNLGLLIIIPFVTGLYLLLYLYIPTVIKRFKIYICMVLMFSVILVKDILIKSINNDIIYLFISLIVCLLFSVVQMYFEHRHKKSK